jgi:ABC-type antimicrobial peptide transport system permease subunit
VANSVLIAQPAPARIRVVRTLRGLRKRHILLAISVFVLLLVAGTGILAPWVSPHDPRRGNLEDQKLPPAWIGEKVTFKTVVDFPQPGLGHEQISIAKA